MKNQKQNREQNQNPNHVAKKTKEQKRNVMKKYIFK
jgi:hypothetical protein